MKRSQCSPVAFNRESRPPSEPYNKLYNYQRTCTLLLTVTESTRYNLSAVNAIEVGSSNAPTTATDYDTLPPKGFTYSIL